jgi:hypothetical protein
MFDTNFFIFISVTFGYFKRKEEERRNTTNVDAGGGAGGAGGAGEFLNSCFLLP